MTSLIPKRQGKAGVGQPAEGFGRRARGWADPAADKDPKQESQKRAVRATYRRDVRMARVRLLSPHGDTGTAKRGAVARYHSDHKQKTLLSA